MLKGERNGKCDIHWKPTKCALLLINCTTTHIHTHTHWVNTNNFEKKNQTLINGNRLDIGALQCFHTIFDKCWFAWEFEMLFAFHIFKDLNAWMRKLGTAFNCQRTVEWTFNVQLCVHTVHCVQLYFDVFKCSLFLFLCVCVFPDKSAATFCNSLCLFVALSGQVKGYKSSHVKWIVLIIILARIVMGRLLKMAFFYVQQTRLNRQTYKATQKKFVIFAF